MSLDKEIMEYDDAHMEERRKMREERLREMKRQKQQQERMRKIAIPCVVVALLIVCGVTLSLINIEKTDNNDSIDNKIEDVEVQSSIEEQDKNVEDNKSILDKVKLEMVLKSIVDEKMLQAEQVLVELSKPKTLDAQVTDTTTGFNSEIVSENGILIDVEESKILAQKDANVRISPASMTKILTVLVAAEHVTDLDEKFTITIDITDYSYVNDCSNTGFLVDEEVTIRDLFYGTILPSGADAALGLAIHVAGSQEEFVKLMNEKLDELGLSDTAHFTNCVGLYDENHYCTVSDMAVIMKAAADNELCREVMSAHSYTTSATEQHPEGITISNWFLRRIEDSDTHGEVLCAKTGYVVQSGSCAASLAVGNDGKEYICVTAHSASSWRCIYDQVALYQQFIP